MTEANAKREVFRLLYEGPESSWGGHSGGGSDAYWTLDYRLFIDKFIRLNNIRSIVDIGCGDWQFSRFLNLDGVRYHGFDVVGSVIEANRRRFGSDTVSFDLMPEDFAAVPDADLLIMKDVLQHLPDSEIMRHRTGLFDRYPVCLLSNSFRKLDTPQNVDTDFGGFRCLDLNATPYHFDGVYVLEFGSALWEQIRTLLYRPRRVAA